MSTTSPSIRVPYVELPRQFDDGAVVRRIAEEFRRCRFILGPQVEQFEARFARVCGTAHAVGLNSGTDALFLALKALGVGPGDEVITAPNSFIATAAAIVHTGARPVFADVMADYTISPERAAAALTGTTRAIVPVHLTGTPADMDALRALAAPRGLPIVEDAAQAVGAAIDGRPVGSLGTAGAFSLFPLKNLGVAGDGGMLVTNSRDLAGNVARLRNHGLRNRDECEVFGYNSRLDTIQAIVGDASLDSLDSVTKRRGQHAAYYDAALRDLDPEVIVPPRRAGARQAFHTYVVQVERRELLVAHLGGHGVETKIHYPIPIHLQPAATSLGYSRGAFPICEAQASRILSLPVHEFLHEHQLAYVVETIRSFYRR